MEELERWALSPLWDEEPTKNVYAYPLLVSPDYAQTEGRRLAVGLPAEEVYELGPFVCASSPESHRGPFLWARDFLIPDSTTVHAAEDGIIVEVQELSTAWGPTSEYRDMLNYLTISHKKGEFSQYCHLAPDSVTESGLAVGMEVKRGQAIAKVGKTGWTDRDHLHFIVFRGAKNESSFPFKSLKIIFEEPSR